MSPPPADSTFEGYGLEGLQSMIHSLQAEPDRLHVLCFMGPDGEIQKVPVPPEANEEAIEALRAMFVNIQGEKP
jgi:hypothetical protein